MSKSESKGVLKGKVKRTRRSRVKAGVKLPALNVERPQGLERQIRGARASHAPTHLPLPSPQHIAVAVAQGEAALNTLTRETKKAHIEAARRCPKAFNEYVFGIKQEWFHDEWQDLFSSVADAMVVAPRGHGKCVPDDGLVTVASGDRVRAADLPEFFDALSWSEDSGWVSKPAHKFADQVQPIVEIGTRHGRTLRVSHEHPIWCDGEWIAARDVKVGSSVATARGAIVGVEEPGHDLAWIVGLLIGDGGLTQPSRIGLTCSDQQLVDLAKGCCDRLGWVMRNRTPSSPGIEWSISGRSALSTMRMIGLAGCGSHEKRVPRQTWRWSTGHVASLLAGYLEADGSVGDGAASRCVEWYSVSEWLMRDVQSLLLRVGVSSGVSKKLGTYKGLPHISWRVTVRGPAIDDLAAALPTGGRKVAQLHAMRSRCANGRTDVVPDSVIDRLLDNRCARGSYPRLDARRQHGQQRWKVLSRARDAGANALVENALLGWDQVTSVKQATSERTWSIEVEDTHAVIVDDFLTHNTTQVLGRLLWELGRNPDLRVKLVCASDSKANERVQEIREHIARNVRLKDVFPGMEPADDRDWTKRKLTLRRSIISRDVTLEALGIGSSVTGGRADMLIFDDICDERNTLRFPELREQIKRTFKAAFAPVLEPNGRTWYVCTLYHAADNSHVLMHNGRYVCACHADENKDDDDPRTWSIVRHDVGVAGDDLKPLWPNVWPRHRLKRRRLKIGADEFDRAYRNITLAGESQLVDPDWIRYEDPPPGLDLITFQAYDLSDGSQKGDAFAGVTIAVPEVWPPEEGDGFFDFDERGEPTHVGRAGPSPVWVIDAFADRIPFGDQVRRIINHWVRFEALHVGIEKAGIEGVSSQIQREPGAPHVPLFRLRPTRSKAQRLSAVSPLVQSGRVRFATHLDPDRNASLVQSGDLVGELTQFPVAKHDDLVDAFVYSLLLLLRWEIVDQKKKREFDSAVGVRVLGTSSRR